MDPAAVPHSVDLAPNSFGPAPSPAYARTERRVTAPTAQQCRRGAHPARLQPRLLFQAAPKVPRSRRAVRAPGAAPRCVAGNSTARYNPHRLAKGSGLPQLIFSPPVAGRRLRAAPLTLSAAAGRLRIL